MCPVIFFEHIGGFTASGVGQLFVIGESGKSGGEASSVGFADHLIDRDTTGKAQDVSRSIVEQTNKKIEGEKNP